MTPQEKEILKLVADFHHRRYLRFLMMMGKYEEALEAILEHATFMYKVFHR